MCADPVTGLQEEGEERKSDSKVRGVGAGTILWIQSSLSTHRRHGGYGFSTAISQRKG